MTILVESFVKLLASQTHMDTHTHALRHSRTDSGMFLDMYNAYFKQTDRDNSFFQKGKNALYAYSIKLVKYSIK